MVQSSSLTTYKTSKTIAGGWKIINTLFETKKLGDDEIVDINSAEIAVTDELVIKVMSYKDLFID